MILFIFEGKKCEPRLFETLKHLFFAKETEPFVCTYNSNIYSLYSKLKGYDVFENVTASGNTVLYLMIYCKRKGMILLLIFWKWMFLKYSCFLIMIFKNPD